MDHVADLLTKKGVSYDYGAKDYVVRCLNPDHNDSSPSMRIDKVTGIFNCFSCGFKGNLFKHYGVVTNFASIKTAKLREKISDLMRDANGVEFPQERIPYPKTYRNISKATLSKFEAFYTDTGDVKLHDRIFFPIKDIRNNTCAYIGRHTLSQGNPRYLIYPAGAKMPIFPQVMPSGSRSVVLVEGIFDALNLYDKGLENVSCVFGTNTLQSDIGMKLLPFKVQGISNIFLLFDGDEAGQVAMTKLKPMIEELGFTVEIIVLPDSQDPGDLPSEDVTSIREYMLEKEANDK